jgi:hypothetical protein
LIPQVHQASSNPLGSGLGYLEHICQLIEKIGQLQEHNLRLQKQICGLQKDGKMAKNKEVSHILYRQYYKLSLSAYSHSPVFGVASPLG